jgi:hypothetical protein
MSWLLPYFYDKLQANAGIEEKFLALEQVPSLIDRVTDDPVHIILTSFKPRLEPD